MPTVRVEIDFEETYRAPGVEFSAQELCEAVGGRVRIAFAPPLTKAKISAVVGLDGKQKAERLIEFVAANSRIGIVQPEPEKVNGHASGLRVLPGDCRA